MNLLLKNIFNSKISILIIMMVLVNSTYAYNQNLGSTPINPEESSYDYAVLISQPNHLKAVVGTVADLNAEKKYQMKSFQVMACGKAVEAFVKGGDMAQWIDEGRKKGITFALCGLSLKQFNIASDTLVDGVKIVPNGLTYLFDLQLQGYKTIEL